MSRRVFAGVAVALFCMIWVPAAWEIFFPRPVLCEVFYDGRDEAYDGIGTVYIDTLTARKGVSQVEKTDNIEYTGSGNYVWYGSQENVKLSFYVNNGDTLRLHAGYYAVEGATPAKSAELTVVLGGRWQSFSFSDFDDTGALMVEDRVRVGGGMTQYLLQCVILLAVFTAVFLLWPRFPSVCRKPVLYVLLFAAALKKYYAFFFPAYIIGGDSLGYITDSLSGLDWTHRMPGYQIFNLAIQKILGVGAADEELFIAVTHVQMILGVLSCVVFYLTLKKLLKREYLALWGAALYAAQPFLAQYEKDIMTESIAVGMMIVWVYMLVCFLKKPGNKLAFSLGVYSLVMTLTRPSFIVLFPVLALFWGIRLLFEKEERKTTLWGIGGAALGTALLLGYCFHNQELTGQFMLSDVSCNNELSILIEGGLYENEAFPDITDYIRSRIREIDSLDLAKEVFAQYSLHDGMTYVKDTIRQKPFAYGKVILWKWVDNAQTYIFDSMHLQENQLKFYYIQQTLLPFTFAVTLLFCLLELLQGIILWWRERKVPYMDLGFPVLILCIMLLSFGTLTHANPQRICIHMVPLVLMMVFRVVERALDRDVRIALEKTGNGDRDTQG